MSTPPPNPYGQPQYPQPQQYPQQGYGGQPPYPQPRYGRPPYPGQGGWGGLPTAPPIPPPKKNRTGLTITLALGSVVLLLGIAWFGNNVTVRKGGGSGFPEAQYRLTLPPTLLDGKYKLDKDLSDSTQDELAGTSQANIRDAKGTTARYLSQAEGGVLVLSGMHGRIKDPDEARSSILKGAGDAKGSTIAVPPKDFTPAGSEVTVTCQVLTSEQEDGGTSAFAMCAWADDNTNAAVALTSVKTAKQSPEEIDLEAAAVATVKVREETRQPIG
ncbi:hypothetical protein [Streptomyces sp. NPDC005408]|uniref:hypothetical protein n=1 Tax=Streptomyces sp. NPDC005408 TaxID=3155341 RepID=UPI0033BED06D